MSVEVTTKRISNELGRLRDADRLIEQLHKVLGWNIESVSVQTSRAAVSMRLTEAEAEELRVLLAMWKMRRESYRDELLERAKLHPAATEGGS